MSCNLTIRFKLRDVAARSHRRVIPLASTGRRDLPLGQLNGDPRQRQALDLQLGDDRIGSISSCTQMGNLVVEPCASPNTVNRDDVISMLTN